MNISDQIKLENERRQESLDLQKRLTEAQIAQTRAWNERLRGGDAIINITADGLEPELEAFMWKIIDRVQIRANTDGATFLLGVQ